MLQAVGKKPPQVKREWKARGLLPEAQRMCREYVEENPDWREKALLRRAKSAVEEVRAMLPTPKRMPGGHRPLAGLRENTVGRLMELRQQKEKIRQKKDEILYEKYLLDVDETNVDEQITWLEEEFRLAAKKEEEEGEEEDAEEEEEDVEEEDVAGIAGLEGEENMEEDLAEEEDVIEEDVAEENMEEDLAEEEDVIKEGVEEEVEEEVKDVEEEEEENTVWNEFDYAWIWHDQGGNDKNIPKEHSPCKYFFKSRDGCQKTTCPFSHNTDIFGKEPFTTMLKNLSWDRKANKKTLPRPPPYPPSGPGPLKKHRRVKGDEEDLP
jgi:hypothetical protein